MQVAWCSFEKKIIKKKEENKAVSLMYTSLWSVFFQNFINVIIFTLKKHSTTTFNAIRKKTNIYIYLRKLFLITVVLG